MPSSLAGLHFALPWGGVAPLLARRLGDRLVDLVAVWALAFLPRVGAVWYLNTLYSVRSNLVAPDAATWYVPFAKSILAGTSFHLENGTRIVDTNIAPLFPLYLAAIFAVLGESPWVVGLVNAAAGSCTCVVTALIGREVFSRRVGIIAGVGLALYPFQLFWTGYVLRETMAVFLFSLSALLTIRALKSARLGSALVAGAATGVVFLARFALKTYLPVLGLLFLFLPSVPSATPRRRALLAAAALLGALAVLGAWSLYERASFGFSRPLWAGTLTYLYSGNGPGLQGETRGYYEARGLEIPDGLRSQRGPYEVELKRAQATLSYLTGDPSRFLERLPSKAVNFFRPVWEGSSTVNWLVLGVPYVVVLALAAIGLLASFQRGARLAVHAVLLYFVAAHLVAYGLIRGRVYLDPYLMLFAAYVVDRLVSPAQRRSGRAAQDAA